MIDRLQDKRDRELDPVEVELDPSADGFGGAGPDSPDVVLGGRGQALRAEAALTGELAGERPAPEAVDAAGERVRLLEEDPDLARGLPEPLRAALTEQLWVRVLPARVGLWTPPEFPPETTFGLLLLDGLIGRRVQIQGAVAVELVAAGDLIRPWSKAERWDSLPTALQWQVFSSARLAVLDERVTAMIARRPELLISFTDRLQRRVRAMSSLMAISHMTRVEDRLLGTLWQIASGCGRVTPDGVRIPIRLTHRLLAELVGAKRPSVTVALQRLRQRGEVLLGPNGDYVLAGRPAAAE